MAEDFSHSLEAIGQEDSRLWAGDDDDDEEEECMSDAEENFSDEDEDQDELGGTRVKVDITRRLWTLREGTFEGVDGVYGLEENGGSPKWRARKCLDADPEPASGSSRRPQGGVEKEEPMAAAADASAATTPDTVQGGGLLADSSALASSESSEDDEDVAEADGAVRTQGSLVVVSDASKAAAFQHNLAPRPLTDAAVVAAAHRPQYGALSGGGDEYGFYAEEGEVQRITADDGFDLEKAMELQEDGLFTDRQRRWMKIPDGEPAPRSPLARPSSALPSHKAPGKKKKWRSAIWVPFSVIVAALPACDSPQVPMRKALLDDAKRKHVGQKVAECERLAAKAVAQGRFMDAIQAVETNIRHRARGGVESPSELLCMLQATAFLCGAYAVECIHRKLLEEAELLLEHAEGLTRKSVLKKCRETDLVRCGLRAATFSVNALRHRQAGNHAQSFRMLQRALKIARQKQGLEMIEAATLINMGSVLMSQGQLSDAITIAGASLSLLSKHEVEAAMAWECEASTHHHLSSADDLQAQAGGRAGRSARMNAVWAMVAMAHHNLGAMHEAARRPDVATLNYQRAQELAQQYLGPASHIASIITAALCAQGSGPSGVKVHAQGGKGAGGGGKSPVVEA